MLYQTHNVTGLLQPGRNAIGLLSGHVFTRTPSIVFLLRIELSGLDHVGEVQTFTSTLGKEGGWIAGPSYVHDDTYRAHVDYTMLEPGWSAVGFIPRNSSQWHQVATPEGTANTPRLASDITIDAMMMPPATALNQVWPIKVSKYRSHELLGFEPGSRAFLYEFPRNFVGTVRIAPLPHANHNAFISVLLGEWVDEANGLPASRNLGETQMETYTLRNGYAEALEPLSVWHGFQFVLVVSNEASFL